MNSFAESIPFSLQGNRNVQLNTNVYLETFANRFVSKLKAYFIYNFNLTFAYKTSQINLLTKHQIGIDTSEFICTPFSFMPMQQDGMLFFDKTIANLLLQQKQANACQPLYITNSLFPKWEKEEDLRFHTSSLLNLLLATWQTSFPDSTILKREMTDHSFLSQFNHELPQDTTFYQLRIYIAKTKFQSFIDLYVNKQQIDTLGSTHIQDFLLHTYKNQATQPYIQEKLNSILLDDIQYNLQAFLENKLISIEDLQKHYKEETPLLLEKPKRSLINLKLGNYTVASGELGTSNGTLSLQLTDTYNNKKNVRKIKIPFIPLNFKSMFS